MLWARHYLLPFLFLPTEINGAFMRKRYMVDVESGSVCADNDKLEIPMRKYRVDRINRTHRAFTMDFSFARPIDKTVEASLSMERWSDGKWVNLPLFPSQADPCKKLMNGPLGAGKDLWIEFGTALGLKHPELCDIPAGNYSLNKYPIDISSEVPFWGGRFRGQVSLRRIKTKQKVWCAGSLLNFVEIH